MAATGSLVSASDSACRFLHCMERPVVRDVKKSGRVTFGQRGNARSSRSEVNYLGRWKDQTAHGWKGLRRGNSGLHQFALKATDSMRGPDSPDPDVARKVVQKDKGDRSSGKRVEKRELPSADNIVGVPEREDRRIRDPDTMDPEAASEAAVEYERSEGGRQMGGAVEPLADLDGADEAGENIDSAVEQVKERVAPVAEKMTKQARKLGDDLAGGVGEIIAKVGIWGPSGLNKVEHNEELEHKKEGSGKGGANLAPEEWKETPALSSSRPTHEGQSAQALHPTQRPSHEQRKGYNRGLQEMQGSQKENFVKHDTGAPTAGQLNEQSEGNADKAEMNKQEEGSGRHEEGSARQEVVALGGLGTESGPIAEAVPEIDRVDTAPKSHERNRGSQNGTGKKKSGGAQNGTGHREGSVPNVGVSSQQEPSVHNQGMSDSVLNGSKAGTSRNSQVGVDSMTSAFQKGNNETGTVELLQKPRDKLNMEEEALAGQMGPQDDMMEDANRATKVYETKFGDAGEKKEVDLACEGEGVQGIE